MKVLFSKLTLILISLTFCNFTFADEPTNRIVVDPNSTNTVAKFVLVDKTMRLRFFERSSGNLKSELSFPMCDRYTNARSLRKKFVALANLIRDDATEDKKLLSINPLIDVDTNFNMCDDENRREALDNVVEVVDR